MNVTMTEDRIVLGNPAATCHECGAEAAVKYAANGRAEFWHAPTDCCEWAKARERRFNADRLESDHRAREQHESAWRASRYNTSREAS